jgi:hypothetical protein
MIRRIVYTITATIKAEEERQMQERIAAVNECLVLGCNALPFIGSVSSIISTAVEQKK